MSGLSRFPMFMENFIEKKSYGRFYDLQKRSFKTICIFNLRKVTKAVNSLNKFTKKIRTISRKIVVTLGIVK